MIGFIGSYVTGAENLMCGKLLNAIKSTYVGLACVRVKRGESKFFRINSGVIQG